MHIAGIAAALLMAIAGTSKDTVSKKISGNISGTLSAFASFLYAIPYYAILIPILYFTGFETFAVTPLFFQYILFRAVSDTGAEWSKMESIARADISLVSAFQSISPAFLVFFSPLITGDPIPNSSILGLLIIAISGVLLANPFRTQNKTEIKGILFAILSAFLFSINHCYDRLAAKAASPVLSAFSMTIMACFFIAPFLLRFSRGLSGTKEHFTLLNLQSRPLLLRGFFEVISLVAKITALQYLTAPTVVAFARLSVPLSIFSGAILLGEKQLGRRLLYASFMIVGSLIALFGE
jgi:drug/metabolite transporter (DMT)-like permease